jgi:hypothetical protein
LTKGVSRTFNHGVLGSSPSGLVRGLAMGVIALGGTVSIFAINPLCREVSRDHAFRAAMKGDPVEALNC